MDGFISLTKESLATSDGINQLNRMLQLLFDLMPGDGESVRIYSGYDTPENVVSSGIGSIYMCKNGGAVTSIYVKESGMGATGWIAK